MNDHPQSYIDALGKEHDRGYKLGVVHGIERAAEQTNYAIQGIIEHFDLADDVTDPPLLKNIKYALRTIPSDLRAAAKIAREHA